MSSGHVCVIVAALSGAAVSGCADQPVPTYTYALVPCPPAASAPTSSSGAAAGESPQPATPPANATDGANASSAAGATTAPTAGASDCVVAVPQYGYAGGSYYDPYWDYRWPYRYG